MADNRLKAIKQGRVTPRFILTEALVNLLKRNPSQTEKLVNRLKKAKGGKVKK